MMKKLLLLTLTMALVLMVKPAMAIPHSPKPTTEANSENQVKSAQEDWESMSKKEQRAKKKEIRKNLKSALKSADKQEASDVDVTLLIILAILIPPLAMGIYDGISKRFWISLLLTLLFFLPGMIYTLVVILREN